MAGETKDLALLFGVYRFGILHEIMTMMTMVIDAYIVLVCYFWSPSDPVLVLFVLVSLWSWSGLVLVYKEY